MAPFTVQFPSLPLGNSIDNYENAKCTGKFERCEVSKRNDDPQRSDSKTKSNRRVLIELPSQSFAFLSAENLPTSRSFDFLPPNVMAVFRLLFVHGNDTRIFPAEGNLNFKYSTEKNGKQSFF